VRQTRARIQYWAPDVLLCNELEAATLGGVEGVRGLARSVVIVKQGALPALIVAGDGTTIEVPSLPLAGVRDTTGAGDAFAAGFLLALNEGLDWVSAVDRGHHSAQAAITLVSGPS
jgi:sugar/nucleoside kinase (ribokinase family)